MVDFKKLLKKHRERKAGALTGTPERRDGAFVWVPTKQAAVEYPDHCPEFWAVVLPELDAEFVHPVRIGNV